MWRLNNLYEVAKTATEHASEYVNTVQTKAQSVVASVKDEAATLLHAIGTTRPGPVDEILYEEIDNYKAFSESFVLDAKTETISKILEEDEEIKDLHEQMVPEEITYEEFWCRYFFREQQDIEHHKQQEERVAFQKKKAEEAASLAAVRKAQLEEKVAAKLMEDSSNGDDFESKISIPATGSSESKWKEKVQELQAKLASMEENSQLEKARISQEMEAKYQSLCDSYENRMAQMTIQIDNSRAAGYDDGIRESEQIIDSIRKSTEKEIEALQQQLALAHQQPSQQQQVEASSTGDDPTILSKLQQENESLSKSLSEKQAKIVELQKKLQQDTEQLKSTYEEKVKLEVELKVLKESFDEKRSKQFEELAVSKKSVLELEAQLKSNIGSSDSTSPATVELSKQLEQMKGEAEIWRVRALKMKKAKEMVDEELRESKAAQEKQAEEIVALQTSQSSSSNDDQVAELQSSIGVLKAHLNELNEQKQTSENNLKSQISAMEQKLEQAALQVEVSYMKGIEEARVTIEAEKQKAFEEGVAKSKEQVQALQSEREALEASYAEELKSSKDAINRLQAEVAELRESKQHVDIETPSTSVTCMNVSPSSSSTVQTPVIALNDIGTSAVVSDEAVATTASTSVDEIWGPEELALDDEPVIRDDWGEW